MIGAIVGIAAAVLQVVLAVTKDGYIQNIGKLFDKVLSRDFTGLIGPNGVPASAVIGMAVLVVGIGIYFTFRWTSILAKESKEPFQYTFWIEPFKQVSGTPGDRFSLASSDRLNLLHHDLMERLSRRITRLSLLNINSDVPAEARNKLTSHINIRGDYAVREVHDGQWVIHVMPTIRIGPTGYPETLAEPVKIELSNGKQASHKPALAADTYNHLIERVYSIVASEIYRQILADVKNKSTLFPTSYLRAVALYYEGIDFERSNTIDAYDHAINLYRKSKRYFDIRLLGGLIKILVRIPVLPFWRLSRRSLLADAKTRIGLARSLIYRRIVSGLSGRNQNILFEIPAELNRVIANLTSLQNHETSRKWAIGKRRKAAKEIEKPRSLTQDEPYRSLMGFLTFPFDSALKRGRDDFDQCRELLAEAYAVAALAYHHLDAPNEARRQLASARACNPDVNQKNHLWLLAAAEIETNINKKLLFLKQATEFAPDFEIAQYRFAHFSEMQLRMRGELRKERVERVIKLYEEVLTINPGNLGALLSQGYLYWLLRDWNTAEKKFNQGCDTKTISRQIFIGEFQYGLARIAVEKGKLDSAYELFDQAIAADPEVAAYAPIQSLNLIHPKYAYITLDVLKQYEDFRRRAARTIERHVKAAQAAKPAITDSQRPLKNLYSFILNDYGNACLNYFHRFGDLKQLTQSIEAYEAAITENKENFVAFFNLDNAYGWRNNMYFGKVFPKQREDPLEQAVKLAPAWPAVLIESARRRLAIAREAIKKKREEIEKKERELDDEVLREKRSLTKSQGAPITAEVAPHEGRTDGSSRSPNAVVKKSPGAKTPAVNSETTGGVQELHSQLEQLRKEVDKSIIKVKKELAPDITKRIMDGTKWSFVPRKVYEDVRVDELLATKIERDRLDDSDIAALEVWATILSTNVESAETLRAAEKLCAFVLSYYPQRFETLRNLSAIYEALASLGSPLLKMEDLLDSKRIAQRLQNSADHKSADPRIDCLYRKFGDDRRALLEKFRELGFDEEFQRVLLAGLNELLQDKSLRDEECFSRVGGLPALGSRRGNSQNVNPIRINRNLLAEIFSPDDLRFGETPGDEVLKTYRRDKKNSENSISGIIRNWLGMDSISFVSLKWATEFTTCLKRTDQVSFLENAVKDAPYQEQNGAYHYLLGNVRLMWAQVAASEDRQKQIEESAVCFQEASRLSPEQPLYLFTVGTVRYVLAQYPEAIENYEKAAKLDPDNSLYHADLANALSANEEWERALAAIEPVKALDNDLYTKKLAAIYSARGDDYYGNGFYASSVQDYKRAAELDPKMPIYQANLALAFTGLKEWESALAAIEKAKEMDNSFTPAMAGIYNTRGNDYYNNGDYASSLKDYDKAIELVPKTPVYYVNVGAALAALNEWDRAFEAVKKVEALDRIKYEKGLALVFNMRGNQSNAKGDHASSLNDYQQAVKLDPDEAVYHANVAVALTGLKEWDRAFAAVEETKELDSAMYAQGLALVHNARGNESNAKGDHESSLKDYEKAVELDPKAAVYHANVAVALSGLKEWDRAFATVEEIKDLDSAMYAQNLAMVYIERGNESKAKGDAESSLKDYQKAVELDPNTAVYHAKVALALVDLKEWERAFAAMEKMKGLDDAYPEGVATIFNARGNDYYSNGDYASSLRDYEKAIELDPKAGVYHANVAVALSGLKEWDRAFAAVEKIKELDSAMYAQNLAMVYIARGNESRAEGDNESSLKDYQKAVEVDPNTALYHGKVALALASLKEWEGAFAAMEKMKPDDAYPEGMAALYNARGNDYYASGDNESSLKDFEKAVEFDPNVAVYHANVAAAFAGLKDWDSALAATEKAKDLDATYVNAMAGVYNARGNQYYSTGDYASALRDYEEAVKFNEGSALYHLNLSIALRELGDWERAVSECTKAIALDPTSADSHHELKLIYNAHGLELLNKGDYKQAIKEFQEAIQAQDGDDIIYYNLGVAWSSLKEPAANENAIKAVQEAIRLNPTNDEYKKLLDQIESVNRS